MSGELQSVLTFKSGEKGTVLSSNATAEKSQINEAAAAHANHESLHISAASTSMSSADETQQHARRSRASLTPLPSPSDTNLNLLEEGDILDLGQVRQKLTDPFHSYRSNRSQVKSLPPSSSNPDLNAMEENDMLDYGHVRENSTDSFHSERSKDSFHSQRSKVKSMPPIRRDKGGFFHASNDAAALRKPLLDDFEPLTPSDTIFSYRQMNLRNSLPSMRPEYMRKIGKQPESHDIKNFESAVQKDFNRSLTKV